MAKRWILSLPEWKASLFLLLGLGLFAGMVLLYSKVSDQRYDRHHVKVLFTSIAGLHLEAPVSYNGVAVGEVKQMRIVHLDAQMLSKIRTFSLPSLVALPLDDELVQSLRLLPQSEFDRQCRDALLGKTMIELTLEILQKGKFRHYNIDDTVFVKTNLMGDSIIEIVAGHDRPVGLEEDLILLGYSGDFFTSLAHSMAEVQKVLASATEVIGAEERNSLSRARARSGTIMEDAMALAEMARARAKVTAKNFMSLEDNGADSVGAFGKLIEDIRPDSHRLSISIKDLETEVSQRSSQFMDEVNRFEKETKDSLRPITQRVDEAMKAAEPHADGIREQLLGLAHLAQRVSGHTTSMYRTGSVTVEQSLPEFERTMAALKISFINLLPLRYIRERIGEIVGKKDKGENEYYVAWDTYKRIQRVSRWPRDTRMELEAIKPWMSRTDEVFSPVKESDIDRIIQKVSALELSFAYAEGVASQTLLEPFTGTSEVGQLPPFPRKRAGVGPEGIPTKKKRRRWRKRRK